MINLVDLDMRKIEVLFKTSSYACIAYDKYRITLHFCSEAWFNSITQGDQEAPWIIKNRKINGFVYIDKYQNKHLYEQEHEEGNFLVFEETDSRAYDSTIKTHLSGEYEILFKSQVLGLYKILGESRIVTTFSNKVEAESRERRLTV